MRKSSEPSRRVTPAAQRAEDRRETERQNRDRPARKPEIPLVKLGSTAASHWPPGTAWLDTSAQV